MRRFYFDIETAPEPEPVLADLYTPLNPDEVKTGNLKDPAKIQAKIEEEQAAHAAEFRERAALSPLTGRVVAIGTLADDEPEGVIFAHAGLPPAPACPRRTVVTLDEADMLHTFWRQICQPIPKPVLVGFNICGFDLPFLIRRSWKLGVEVPDHLLHHGLRWTEMVHDLALVWHQGDRMARTKLDAVARFLGIPGKTGDHGAHFGQLWATEAEVAADYLRQDVILCRELDRRLVYTMSAIQERLAVSPAADPDPLPL